MAFEDYKTKESVVIVYTGEGKGKTSAGIGLLVRALGAGWSVAFIQFIKNWQVSEHNFIENIQTLYGDKLLFHKGGKGFYNAGQLSAEEVSDEDHKSSAVETFEIAKEALKSGKYNLVICDEINNAVHDDLLQQKDLELLIKNRDIKTSLCLTGRNFPIELLNQVDIATHMTKIKHHYDDKYLANKGIDF